MPPDGTETFVAQLRRERPMTMLCDEFGITGRRLAAALPRGRDEGLGGPVASSPTAGSGVVRGGGRSDRGSAAAAASLGPEEAALATGRTYPEMSWPAPSTIGAVLRREGLVRPDGRRQRRWPRSELRAPKAPNDVWGVDFKGWFRTRNGEPDPLTVTDLWSRFVLQVVILPIRTAEVRQEMESLFERYGVPGAIRSDNGAPFAGPGVGGLSRLSVDWLKAGIRLERIDGKPHQNGSHERFAARDFGGKCETGGYAVPPFTDASKRERPIGISPPRAGGAQGSSDCRREASFQPAGHKKLQDSGPRDFAKKKRPIGISPQRAAGAQGSSDCDAKRRALQEGGVSRSTPSIRFPTPCAPLLERPTGWMRGLEPPTTGTTIRCSAIELHPPPKSEAAAGWRAREDSNPPTRGLEGRRSVQTELLALPRFVFGPGRTVARRPARPLLLSGREDLNLRLPAPKAGALPDCATPRETREV